MQRSHEMQAQQQERGEPAGKRHQQRKGDRAPAHLSRTGDRTKPGIIGTPAKCVAQRHRSDHDLANVLARLLGIGLEQSSLGRNAPTNIDDATLEGDKSSDPRIERLIGFPHGRRERGQQMCARQIDQPDRIVELVERRLHLPPVGIGTQAAEERSVGDAIRQQCGSIGEIERLDGLFVNVANLVEPPDRAEQPRRRCQAEQPKEQDDLARQS